MPVFYPDTITLIVFYVNSSVNYTLRKSGSNIRVVSGSFYFDPLRVTFDPIWIVLIRFRINIYKWIKFTWIIFDLISGSKFWSVFLDHFDPERMSSYLILCSDQKWSFLSHIWSWLSKSDSRKCIHTIISPDLPTASRGRVVRAMVSYSWMFVRRWFEPGKGHFRRYF